MIARVRRAHPAGGPPGVRFERAITVFLDAGQFTCRAAALWLMGGVLAAAGVAALTTAYLVITICWALIFSVHITIFDYTVSDQDLEIAGMLVPPRRER